MLFTALYEIPMETLRECQDRFMNQEEKYGSVDKSVIGPNQLSLDQKAHWTLC